MPDNHSSTLCDSFARAVNWGEHRPAIAHAGNTTTYRELFDAVKVLADQLHRMQFEPGERIAIIANKTPQTVITLLAALHTSTILVIINPLLKRDQIEHILRNSGATTLFCQADKMSELFSSTFLSTELERVVIMPASSATNRALDANSSKGDQLNCDPSRPLALVQWTELMKEKRVCCIHDSLHLPVSSDLAIILYTSGSTGRPKGVMLTHANLWHGADSVTNYLKNTSADRILALMPLSFDYGLNQLTSAIHAGACLVLHDYVIPKALVKVVVENEITGIPAVPHLWDQLTRIDWPSIPSLRYLTSTGGRLQVPTIEKLTKCFPNAQLYSMYGFTEAFRGTYLPPEQLTYRPSSIGKAVPHAVVMVVDENGNEQPAGITGELIQSGPLVSFGYWNDTDASIAKIRPRSQLQDPSQQLYAWSGDLAYTDEEGFIYFVSRKDDMVKLNGFRISLAEIEEPMLTCPWISEIAVQCVPDQHFGHVSIAFVILSGPASADTLIDWARQKLPAYMIPAKWFSVDALPMTPNNKIDRKSLDSSRHGVQLCSD